MTISNIPHFYHSKESAAHTVVVPLVNITMTLRALAASLGLNRIFGQWGFNTNA